MSAQAVPDWVATYVGLPYAPRGRSPGEGLDCWGLVRWALWLEWGVRVPSFIEGYREPEAPQEAGPAAELGRAELLASPAREWAEVPVEQAAPGDVILLRVQGVPMHVGLVVAPGRMLHVLKGVDACVEQFTSTRWAHRVAGVYRHERVAAHNR